MDKKFKPKAYDIIYWLTEGKKIDSDQLFDFLELFWPTFIELDGYIFLKQKFSNEEYERLTTQKTSPEFWINLLTVDDFFNNSENWEKDSIKFSKELTGLWKTKLQRDFPSLEFSVKYLEDSEYGDYGLTFYQTKHGGMLEKHCGDEKSHASIPRPNIKENKNIPTPNGPKPGKPTHRQPRADEIPNTK